MDNYGIIIISARTRESIAISDFKVYPVPANEEVTIETSERGKLEIFDATGRVLKEVASDIIKVNLSGIVREIFNLKINDKATKLVVK